jgi:hypothetical protein
MAADTTTGACRRHPRAQGVQEHREAGTDAASGAFLSRPAVEQQESLTAVPIVPDRFEQRAQFAGE